MTREKPGEELNWGHTTILLHISLFHIPSNQISLKTFYLYIRNLKIIYIYFAVLYVEKKIPVGYQVGLDHESRTTLKSTSDEISLRRTEVQTFKLLQFPSVKQG